MAAKKNDFIKVGEGFVDVTLSRPLSIGGSTVSTLRMREPIVADQLAAANTKGTEADREIAYMANLCEVSPDDIKALPVRDFNRCQAAFAVFID